MVATVDQKAHKLITLDDSGDTKLIFDPRNEDEVSNSRRSFDDLKKKVYSAFAVDKEGNKGARLTSFDPDAEKLILTPPMKGG